jgi:hypothetical protein
VAVSSDELRTRAIGCYRMQGRTQKMRRLTVVLFRWSTASIADGGELGFADSGDVAAEGNDRLPVTGAIPPRFPPL